MPIYVFRCGNCSLVWEEFFHEASVVVRECPACGNYAKRAHDKEQVSVRGDIEPHYNQSLGEYVGSRQEWRERLAYHDARDENLMRGSNPSAGRLVKEERAEVEGRSLPSEKTIFERRRESGWGEVPRDNVYPIAVKGEADYKEIIDYGKRKSRGGK